MTNKQKVLNMLFMQYFMFSDNYECKYPKKLPVNETIKVPKGETITLMFKSDRLHDDISSPCSIIVTFTITEKEYHVNEEHSDEHCSVSMFVDNGIFSVARAWDYKKRQKVSHIFPFSPFCKADSRFK